LRRKLELLDSAGGACQRCGYNRNAAALTFHHRDPGSKKFNLDLCSLSNRRWRDILREAGLCDLLCANCHAEVHNPKLSRQGALPANRGALPLREERRRPQPADSIMLCE